MQNRPIGEAVEELLFDLYFEENGKCVDLCSWSPNDRQDDYFWVDIRWLRHFLRQLASLNDPCISGVDRQPMFTPSNTSSAKLVKAKFYGILWKLFTKKNFTIPYLGDGVNFTNENITSLRRVITDIPVPVSVPVLQRIPPEVVNRPSSHGATPGPEVAQCPIEANISSQSSIINLACDTSTSTVDINRESPSITMNGSPLVCSVDDESSSTSEVLLEQHDDSDILRSTHQDAVLQQDAAPIITTQEAMLRQVEVPIVGTDVGVTQSQQHQPSNRSTRNRKRKNTFSRGMSQYEPNMSATATNNLSTRMVVGRGVMGDGQGIPQHEPQRFPMLANNMITNRAGHRGISQPELQFPNQNYCQATNPINRNLARIGNTNNTPSTMGVGQGIPQHEPQRFPMLANNMITNRAGHRGISQPELQFPNQNYCQAINPINRNLAGTGNTNNTPSTMGDYYYVGDIMRNGICLGQGTNCSCMVTMPFISQETLMARNANPPTTIEEEREFWDRHIAEMDERYGQELEQETRLLRIRLETIRRGVSDKRKLLDYLNRRIGL